jgi:hypothetical protein
MTAYETLRRTAEKFVHSTDFSPPASTLDRSALRAVCANNYKQVWGHEYFISLRPHLNKVLDLDGFMGHLDTMTAMLESAETEITDITIDQRQRKVVVRATYRLRPKGSKEAGENDIVWILKMDERGEKVESGTEFIDGEAAMRLEQLIKESNVAN